MNKLALQEISKLRTGEEDAWDSYVCESDASMFYHQIGWRNVVLKTYGHKPRYLVARADDGGIARVLPMFLMGSRVFGRKLIFGSIRSVWWGVR